MKNENLVNPYEFEEKEKSSPNELIFAHFSKDELESMDEMQGGVSVRPVDIGHKEVDVREYSNLGKLIENPEYREEFINIAHHFMADPYFRKTAPEEVRMLEKAKGERPFVHVEADQNPTMRKLAGFGEDGDNEIALIPMNLAHLLDELSGGPHVNEHTHFRQYNFFKKLLGIAAPVLGALALGPVGLGLGAKMGLGAIASTGLGAGLGGMLGSRIQNGNWKDSLKTGLISGGIGALGAAAFPALTGAGGAAAGATGATAAGTSAGVGGAASALGAAAPAVAGEAAKEVAKQGIMDTIMSPGVMLPAAGAMYMLGQREDKRNQERSYEHEENEKKSIGRALQNYNKLKPADVTAGKYDPYSMYHEPVSAFREYREGGQVESPKPTYVKFPSSSHFIKGKGKGQDDLLYGKVREKDFILRADTVSGLGDGSSAAGAKEIGKYLNKIRSSPIYKREKKIKTPFVDVALSNEEYHISRPDVVAIGKGSEELGAHKLRKLMFDVAKDKSSQTGSLPKKAKSIEEYLND